MESLLPAVQCIESALQLTAAGPPNVDFSSSSWGWADIQPSVCQRETTQHKPDLTFLEALCASRAYRSPACPTALSMACTLGSAYEGMFGSAVLSPPPSVAQIEQLRASTKQHINAAWSMEAVKQGVHHAKAGLWGLQGGL